MPVTREEVQAMVSALAPFVHSDDSVMEFRLINPEVEKTIKNFTWLMTQMSHGMRHDIHHLFGSYAKAIGFLLYALNGWLCGEQMNPGEIIKTIITGELNFPLAPQKMDKAKMLPEARLQYEIEWASFYTINGICEVWEETAKHWVQLERVRHHCRCTIVTALEYLKRVAAIKWCIENQATDRIEEEIKRVEYKSLTEIADEPFWSKKWSDQYANWEQEIG